MVEMSWLATVRGRVGYAVDRWLIYATGGLALTDGRYRNYDFCDDIQAQCGSGLMDARGETTTGWTVGAGLEMAFTDNWTAKAEYLFMRFDGSLYTGTARFPEAGGGVETEDYRFSASPADLQLFRIGLNYKLSATGTLKAQPARAALRPKRCDLGSTAIYPRRHHRRRDGLPDRRSLRLATPSRWPC